MKKGDNKRPQSVKAKFDQNFTASPYGGGVLIERVLRRLNIQRVIKKALPKRSKEADYQTEDCVYALMAGLLLGGRGISAGECIRHSETTTRIFGMRKGVPSPPTLYRSLCELAGLEERPWEKTYKKRGSMQIRLTLGGKERRLPAMRRIVPEEPEWASLESRERLEDFTAQIAKRCAQTLERFIMRLHGWYVIFGDGTDLEVKGNCFDAARMGRDGEKILRLMSLMLGPITVGQDILPGNVDEGVWLPKLIQRARQTVREIIGRRGKVLSLLDAAFFESKVIKELDRNRWTYIICANRQRDVLKRLALEQPKKVWEDTGMDEKRKWRCSQVCVFTHTPQDWDRPVNIVCRRWQEEEEFEGCWHYSFLATRIEPEDIPEKTLKRYGYAFLIWLLYATKQGRENHFKTPLIDLGLHHPPSCRLGVNQVFYTLAMAASNIAMVLRYRVMPKERRGMHLFRMRELLFQIAGYIRTKARTLTVHLAGGDVPVWMQEVFNQAYAEAGRL